ncbi:DUF4132 domain-containing protein [Actinomadura sp. 9N407]|uniref:DUF4132 domain-containing protein n=1 Tax=Actinomadura sp. 9N407 TaxID=3375154 RepID=UPI0037BAC40C
MNDHPPVLPATGALPRVLADPPWLRAPKKDRPKDALPKEALPKDALATLVPGLEPPCGERPLIWEPGERDRWIEKASFMLFVDRTHDDPWWDGAHERFLSGEMDIKQQARELVLGPEHLFGDLLPLFLERVDEPGRWSGIQLDDLDDYQVMPLVAWFGHQVLDVAYRVAKRRPADHGETLLPFLDAEVARLMADWLVRLKSAQEVSRAWFARHGATAVPYLVPDALGERRAPRDKARAALHLIASEAGVDEVAEAARVHGDPAAGTVAELLASEVPVERPGTVPRSKPSKIPAWLDVEALPRPLLRDGGTALPPAAVGHLVTVLGMSADVPYPGLDEVREKCAPDSLADFAWALFQAWRDAGEPNGGGWLIAQLGWLGDDATARRLTPVIREWPGKGSHAKATRGVGALAEIGTDVALILLSAMARKNRYQGLQGQAQEKIEEVARRRGLSPDRLADRLVPDFGLDAQGGMVLDYGPRRFLSGFDEQLKPFVTDEAGRRLRTLPKPGAKDDPELAPAAHRRFAALKKDVRAVAADQILRLESAMVTGRRWTPDEFRTFFVHHPLLRHLARRLVWTTGGRSFRIAEDLTFADATDDPFDLPDAVGVAGEIGAGAEAGVGVAHPLDLDVKAWSDTFADYEILQPFPQLARPVHELTDTERVARRLERFQGITVPFGAILALTQRDWERGVPQDSGVEPGISRPFGDGLHVLVDLEPGIAAGSPDAFAGQKLVQIRIAETLDHWWELDLDGDSHRFGELDPVTASEILADLTELAARADR